MLKQHLLDYFLITLTSLLFKEPFAQYCVGVTFRRYVQILNLEFINLLCVYSSSWNTMLRDRMFPDRKQCMWRQKYLRM